MTREMKIVHFADVHLGMENYGKIDPQTGLNTRLADFTKAFDTITEFSIKEKIDLVVFAGDAYKTRDPSPTYQREFAKRIFQLASANIPVVMVIGNHDTPNALGKADTLAIFSTLDVANVYIFTKEDLITIPTATGPIQVAGLPWFTRGNLLAKKEMTQNAKTLNNLAAEKLTHKVKYLSSLVKDNMPAILVGHASVEKAVYGSERQVTIGSEIVLPLSAFQKTKFQAVFLGHLHRHQILKIPNSPPIVYSGSIERIDFGEEKEDKGFVLAKISEKKGLYIAKIEFKKIPVRLFITIRIKIENEDENPTQKVINIIRQQSIKDAVIKVIIETPEEKSPAIREGTIKETLKDAAFIAAIIKEVRKAGRLEIKNGYSDELASLDQLGLLEKYLLKLKMPRTKIELLKKETQKILEEEML